MWVAKLKIRGENALVGSRAKKFKITISGYPVSFYEKRDGIYLYFIAFMSGEKENIKKFLKDLKKDKRVLHLENNRDFLIGQIKEPKKFAPLHHFKIVRLEPVIINKDGIEFWTIGSWDRKEIIDFINLIEKTHYGELLSISQQKVTDFSIIRMRPQLTSRQEKAIELAIINKYYQIPRKIKLEELAKLMNVSYSTYQAHLRKAEQKLLPFFFEKSSK